MNPLRTSFAVFALAAALLSGIARADFPRARPARHRRRSHGCTNSTRRASSSRSSTPRGSTPARFTPTFSPSAPSRS